VGDVDDDLAARLGRNVKQLREARGLTQQRIAKLADVPRATWAHLESGEGNPTLAVLHRTARALGVSLEELIATPRAGCAFHSKSEIRVVTRGSVRIKKLLPDPIPGMEMDRIEIPPHAKMAGIPHTPGTREYLTCEAGEIVLVAAGETFHLTAGDLVAFRGDQRHSYANPIDRVAVGYSVVVLAKM
jgi:XRE family transcriptional regulator, regulator of sulfur utilization